MGKPQSFGKRFVTPVVGTLAFIAYGDRAKPEASVPTTASNAGRDHEIRRDAGNEKVRQHGSSLRPEVIGRRARRQRDSDLDAVLPIPPGPVSNGEFVPADATASDRATGAAMRAAIDDASKRAGVPRRQFLRTSAALAASLAALDACSASGTKSKGGAYRVPPAHDTAACEEALTGTEFIFDVHTHHVVPNAPWRHNAPETVRLVEHMLPADCRSADRLDCVDRTAYVHDVFLNSDTTVAMLTDVPSSGADDAPVPLSEETATRDFVAQLASAGANRVLVNSVIAPNVGPVQQTFDAMSAAAADGQVASFKVYTAWSPQGRGYSLEDPAVGLPIVQHAHDLGVKVFVAHKGLPLVHFDESHNGPEDVVAVAKQFPDMQFVVFHAGWNPRQREGAYVAGSGTGIDRLLTALDRGGVAPNSNVWVDVATVWRQVMTRPDEAAHVLGKLLVGVGESRVLWGTDAIWYGGPQAQIAALRAFEITSEFQQRYGYPALTAAVKSQVFGRNAASLFGIDPGQRYCALDESRAAAKDAQRDGALPPAYLPRGPSTRREMLSWLASPATRWRPS
jgi:predicted TIM-barrel fold metal-dependent hydrolase